MVCTVFRCYAALGDVSKARYLKEVDRLAEQITRETVSSNISVVTAMHTMGIQGQKGSGHYLVQERLAVLTKQFKKAEQLLLERVSEHACCNASYNTTMCYRVRYNRQWTCT